MSKSTPHVAVIIASYGGEEVIGSCLSSLFASDYTNFEVVFVNNGSKDKTRAIVAEQFPQVRIIDSAANLGFAGGYNIGMKQAQDADIIILVNDDVVVEQNWLSQLVNAFDEDNRVGVIGCKMLYPDKKTIQHAGGIIYPNGRTWHRGNGEIDTGQWDKLDEPDYVTGAAIAFRRELLDTLGYLDEGYKPIYFEETEYCWRAKQLGYKIIYLPTAKVYHFESRVTGKASAGFFEKYHRNRIRFILKNFSLIQLYFALQEETKFRESVKGTIEYPSVVSAYYYNLSHLLGILFARWQTKWHDRKAKKDKK